MKKFLVVGLLGVLGIVFMAAGCQVINTSLTTITGKDVFAGELKNDSGVNILNHKYRISFINGSTLVETKTVEGCTRSVKNGESNYFSVKSTGSSATAGLARIANLAEDSSFKVGDQAASDITISDLSIRRDADSITISGKIKNNSSDTLFKPNACAVVFDDGGKVVVVQKDTSVNDLDQNETDTFSITIDLTDVTDISNTINSVDVAVDGLDGSTTGTPVKPKWDRDNNVTVCSTATSTTTATATPTNTATATPTGTLTPPASTNTPTATATACTSS